MAGGFGLAFVPRHAGGLEHALHTQRRGLGNLRGDFAGLGELLAGRHHLLNQAGAQGLFGVPELARQQITVCRAPAHLARQAQGGTATGEDAALDFQHGKARVRGRHTDLGVEHDLNAPGEAVALHGHHHRLGVALGLQAEGVDLALAHFKALAVAKDGCPLVQLDTRAEMRALAVQQAHAQIGVAAELAIGPRQVTVHLGRERVVLLGPVDLDLQDVAVLMGFDVGHVRRLFFTGWIKKGLQDMHLTDPQDGSSVSHTWWGQFRPDR